MLNGLLEKISTNLLAKLAAWCIPAATVFAIALREKLVRHIEQSTPESITIAIVVLGLLFLGLAAWILYLLPSFKYIHKYQFYQHRVNGLYYCPPCRTKKPLSPLRYEKSGWRCPFKECGKFYKDPDYVTPPFNEKDYMPTHDPAIGHAQSWMK